jgi:phytol kinase
MSTNALASLAAFAAWLLVLEWLRRGLGVPADVTRKLFHMGVGLAALAAALWFDDGVHAAMPFLVLAGIMYLSFRFEIFEAVEDDGASLGSVLLPLACALLLLWFWGDRVYVAVAGIFAASFGDTTAALVGRRMGTRKYRTLGHPRSMEGTLSLFLASGLTMAPVLAILGGLGSHQAIAFALISATVAASVETVSVYGTDNLTVPIATAATVATLVRFSQ